MTIPVSAFILCYNILAVIKQIPLTAFSKSYDSAFYMLACSPIKKQGKKHELKHVQINDNLVVTANNSKLISANFETIIVSIKHRGK